MAASSSTNLHVVNYNGCNFFRQRIVLASLSGKTVRIGNIRSREDDPGLRDFEVNFIRLMDKITNGSKIEVNESGTEVLYQPGLLYGGTIEHSCTTQRGIGYYLEGVLALAPFCKKPLNVILRGVTNDQVDPSVDSIKNGAIPVLKRFLVDDEGLELKVIKRGAAPGGGGEVVFRCPVTRKLRPIQLMEPGKVKRVRGVAYALRVSPTIANRMVEAAKSLLLRFLPDVYIYTDHRKGNGCGPSAGFGLSLVAETMEGVFLTAEASANPPGKGDAPSVAEDVGREAAGALLEEVYRGGCVESASQSLALLFMALGQKDVSKVMIGPLSPYTIQFMRHMRDYFQLMYKLERQNNEEEEDLRVGADKIIVACVGVGFTNLNKTVT